MVEIADYWSVWMSSVGSWCANGTPTQGLKTCGKVLGCLHLITATLWIHVLGVASKLMGDASPMVILLAYFSLLFCLLPVFI